MGAAQANHRHYTSLADYAQITAPTAGSTWRYATRRTGAAGTSAQRATVVKLAKPTLRLRIPVPAALALCAYRDPADIRSNLQKKLTGKVVRTPVSDLATRTLQVEIDLDNAGNKSIQDVRRRHAERASAAAWA